MHAREISWGRLWNATVRQSSARNDTLSSPSSFSKRIQRSLLLQIQADLTHGACFHTPYNLSNLVSQRNVRVQTGARFVSRFLAHVTEVLSASGERVHTLLQEPRESLGGCGLEESFRLQYAEDVAAVDATWQVRKRAVEKISGLRAVMHRESLTLGTV